MHELLTWMCLFTMIKILTFQVLLKWETVRKIDILIKRIFFFFLHHYPYSWTFKIILITYFSFSNTLIFVGTIKLHSQSFILPLTTCVQYYHMESFFLSCLFFFIYQLWSPFSTIIYSIFKKKFKFDFLKST